jgi:hypothetical protein
MMAHRSVRCRAVRCRCCIAIAGHVTRGLTARCVRCVFGVGVGVGVSVVVAAAQVLVVSLGAEQTIGGLMSEKDVLKYVRQQLGAKADGDDEGDGDGDGGGGGGGGDGKQGGGDDDDEDVFGEQPSAKVVDSTPDPEKEERAAGGIVSAAVAKLRACLSEVSFPMQWQHLGFVSVLEAQRNEAAALGQQHLDAALLACLRFLRQLPPALLADGAARLVAALKDDYLARQPSVVPGVSFIFCCHRRLET